MRLCEILVCRVSRVHLSTIHVLHVCSHVCLSVCVVAEVVLKSAEKVNQQFRFDEDYPKDYTPPPVQAFSMIPGIEREPLPL